MRTEGREIRRKKKPHTGRVPHRSPDTVVVIDPPGPTIEHNAYKLGAAGFEELCCALLRAERQIQSADLYGRPRQGQFGVDVVGRRRDQRGIEVVSCKCYLEVKKGEIAVFADDFLKHWKSHWKRQRVKRFVLAVPADLRSRERLDEIDSAERRFKKLRVRFEVWHKRELTHRIRRDSDIRREFFGEWTASSSPTAQVVAPQEKSAGEPLAAAIVNQIHELQTALGESIGAQLDQYTDSWRRGDKAKVTRSLSALRRSKRWKDLKPDVQARVLRMQALHAMDGGSLGVAERLLKSADQLAPKTGRRFHALLAHQRLGPKQALKILGQPETRDEALLRAGLLLESGHPADALSTLRQWQSRAKDDPEWRRLIACATFMQGQRSVGIEHIREAEKLAPTWTSVIRTGAILRYGAALSPAARFRITRVPEHVHINLVLQDDDSQGLLREALGKFTLLAQKQLTALELEEVDLWKFACLANIVGREKEARSLCASFLKRRPLSTTALFWGLARGYRIDRDAITRRLEAKLRGRTRNVDDLQALLACYFAANDTDGAERALARHAKRFADSWSKSVVAIWHERLTIKTPKQLKAAAQKQPFTALERIASSARESKDWSALEPFLRATRYAPDVVFAACEALAAQGQWAGVVPHADRLLESVASAEATRLAVYALYNTEAFDLALKALDQYPDRFPAGVLPPDLQRLKVYATARQGDLLSARDLATALAQKTERTADRLFAAQLHITGGDVSGALPFVRDALEDGKPAQLLQLVPSVFNEDPALARQLVQKALAHGLNPQEGVFALGWAFKLGLEREAHQLLTDLAAHQDATNGALRAASVDDVIAHIRKQQEVAAELTQRYERGDGPIHVVAGALNVNLARIWRNAFEGANTGAALLVRHGNRSTDFLASSHPPVVTLALDITALLSAEWVGLLDVLEASKVRIGLPNSLIAVLQHLEQDAHHQQPSRMQTLQLVVDYVDSDADRHLASSQSEQQPAAALIVFELDNSVQNQGSSLPRVALGSLASELESRGRITNDEFTRMRTELSGWQGSGAETDIHAVRTLVFEHNTIDTVIEAGLFEAVKSHFEVRVQREHYQNCVAELREYRAREALAERLKHLRRRVADGINRGRYTLLRPGARNETQDDSIAGREILLQPLRELFAMAPAQDHWVWLDDRYCTGFINAQGNTIVSVYEVLRYLKDEQQLSTEAFFESLAKLRRASVSFLPITVEEVMHWLGRAELEDDGVIETPELVGVRVALNDLLRREPDLQLELTGPPYERTPEVHALVIAFRIARECLEEIWRAPEIPIDTRLARSDWVWEALRVERFSRLPVDNDENMRRKLWQMSLAHLLSIGVSIPFQSENGTPDAALKAFNEWLKRQLADLGKRGASAMLDAVASALSELLLGALGSQKRDEPDEKPSLKDARRILGRFVEALPQEIRRRVYNHAGLRAALRPQLITAVNLGDVAFEAHEFYAALEAAWTGKASKVTSVRKQTFQVARDGIAFILTGKTRLRFADPDLMLLDQDVASRREFVRGQQALVTDALDELDSVVAQVAEPDLPFERMKRMRELRETVTASRYARVSELLASRTEFAASELFPSRADKFVAYLGLRGHEVDKWRWMDMIQKLGWPETLCRFGGIPVRLPRVLVDHFCALDSSTASVTVEALRKDAVTPLRRLKLLELLTASEPNAHASVTEALLTDLLANWEVEAGAFNAVLLWSERVWHRDALWHSLPHQHRLACVWAHADRVLSLFSSRGIGGAFVEQRFDKLNPSEMRDLLPFDRVYESDVSAPKRITMEALLVYGLNAALGAKSRSLLDSQRAALVKLVTSKHDQGLLPAAGLLADRRAGEDALTTFFSTELDRWYSENIRVGENPLLTDAGREEMRVQTVGLVSAEPMNANAWMQVDLVGFQWLPSEARAVIEEKLEALTLGLTAEDVTIAHVLAKIVPHSGTKARTALARELVEWAKKLAVAHTAPVVGESRETPADRAAVALIELAFALSRNPELRETLSGLDRVIKEIVKVWPATSKRLRDIVTMTLRGCTWDEAAALWSTLVTLRARP